MRAYEPEFLLFASDATLMSLWGALFLAAALVALAMERRRMRRAGLGSVGWVPWTGLFMVCTLLGGSLLAVGLPAAIAG